jgi:hypothetical protein
MPGHPESPIKSLLKINEVLYLIIEILYEQSKTSG